MDGFTIVDFLIVAAIIGVIGYFGWQFWKKKQEKAPAEKIAPTVAVGSVGPELFIPRVAQPTQTQAVQTSPTQAVNLNYPATALPDPWMPLNAYPSVGSLLTAVRENNFSQLIRVNGVQLTRGFGPGADYVTNSDGSVVFGRPIPPIVRPEEPKPIDPPKPEVPQPTGHTPTSRELQAGVLGGPAYGEFGAKADGERFPSHEIRALWTDSVLGQGTTPNPPTTSPPLVPAVDARILNDLDWAYYNNHPEVHSMVYGDPQFMAQNINRVFYAGSSDQTKFDLRGYNGPLRLQ